jgi:hypothetical protein
MKGAVIVLGIIILVLVVILAFRFNKMNAAVSDGQSTDAQETEEVLPYVEDKGTCETTGDWSMTDQCQADGTAIFTQTYRESKPGACPSSEKARVKPCCYQKLDWTDASECKSNGMKQQQQTTVNCADSVKTREVTCEYLGPWGKIGACASDGIQYYNRVTVNSVAPTTKSEKCCYKSPWGSWGDWGACDGSSRTRTRRRTAVNCPSSTTTSDTGKQTCNHCVGSFGPYGEYGAWSTCPGKSRCKYQYYKVTKAASNGGNACPYKTGDSLKLCEYGRCVAH